MSPGDPPGPEGTRTHAARLPAAIWTLGFVSLLMDISSEMIHSLVPLVMVAMNAVYAASAFPFGHLADRIDRRWLLAAGLVVHLGAEFTFLAGAAWALFACVAVLSTLGVGPSRHLR